MVEKVKQWRKNYQLIDHIVREDGKVRREASSSFAINPEGLRVRKRAMALLLDEIGIPSPDSRFVKKRHVAASEGSD